ncbi:hypothetical protein HLRTI_000477 [Halorhabdus tiamatea SARL4B]|uniref:Uncharacterized protein n=1 Tax=Halorhabdus tiamatea SARL4B TaxID=1033806 RepID=F7PLX6_9EURY|nr:hypothetical protein [Halorhabdus tiamatea]ERJ07435.1 hypothetical protein HLRTI_000477 [Halorhabdus tiamatea SARL4B]
MASDDLGEGRESVPEPLDSLPEELNGWHREMTQDRALVEYWKRGSTHINGAFEQIAVTERHDGELSCAKHAFDQFRHSITTTTLTRQSPERADWIATRIRRETDRYPGDDGYTEPPTFPERIGVWSAVSRQHFDGADATRWVFDPDYELVGDPTDGPWDPDGDEAEEAARLELRETSIEAHYSYSRRYYDIAYQDAEIGPRTIAKELPRTSAFEIAENTLSTLSAPVSHLEGKRDRLTEIPGIGPAKSADFLLLGLTTPAAIAACLEDESSEVNCRHWDRVEALLTSRIRDEIGSSSR